MKSFTSIVVGFVIVLAGIFSYGQAANAYAQALNTMSVAELYSVKRITALSISPDGLQVLYTLQVPDVAANVTRQEVWVVGTGGSVSPRLVKDFTKDGGSGFTWARDSKSIYYVTRTGDEIKRIDLDDLAEQSVTKRNDWKFGDEADFTVGAIAPLLRPSPDGKYLGFSISRAVKRKGEAKSTERPSGLQVGTTGVETEVTRRFFQTTLADLASHNVTAISKSTISAFPDFDWSPDSKQVVFMGIPEEADDGTSFSVYRGDLYIGDVASASARPLVQRAGTDSRAVWSPDGKWIAFLSMKNYTYCPCSLGVVPASGGDVRDNDVEEFSPSGLTWSRNSKSVFSFNTYRQLPSLSHYSLETKTLTRIIPHGLNRYYSNFSQSENGKIAFIKQSVTEPGNIYVASSWDLQDKKKITDLNPQLEVRNKPQFEQIKWRSSDNKFDIYAILVKPIGYQSGKRYPLLVMAEGGPGMASARFGLMSEFPLEPLAARGYLLLYPNTRGRPGEGAEFEAALGKEMKYTSSGVQDALDGVDMLVKQGIADPDRLAIMGHSYGGTFTYQATTMTDRFKAAIVHEGSIVDLVRLQMKRRTDERRLFDVRKAGIGSIEVPKELELLKSESPLLHVDRVRTPTLMEYGGYGQSDPLAEVKAKGIDEYFQSLQYFKVPSELIIYPKEGHGWSELKTKVESANRYIEWLDYWVRGVATERMAERYGPPKNPAVPAITAVQHFQ